MEMSLKVASPLTTDTTNVPDNVPLPGLLLITSVIASVAVGTKLPPASCTWTLSAGEIVAAAVVLVGSTLYTSCVAAPTVTSKFTEVAVISPEAVASSV